MQLKDSKTRENLMRAFAGESQARNRYTFAAEEAKKKGMHAVAEVFLFTANQEKEHGELFYGFLKELTGENIMIDGGYPIDLYDTPEQLLRAAQHNEFEESDSVYLNFGATAKEEGFLEIAATFDQIAKIEKAHGERFGMLAELIEKNELYTNNNGGKWMCLNCGHIHEGNEVPVNCPVCKHEKGFFIPIGIAPYTRG